MYYDKVLKFFSFFKPVVFQNLGRYIYNINTGHTRLTKGITAHTNHNLIQIATKHIH